MKTLIATLLITVPALNAATLSFGTSTVFASNWGSPDGPNRQLVWGVVVDTAGDGFAAGSYLSGINYATGYQRLSTSAGLTDDVLVIHTAGNIMSLTTAANDGGTPIGTNRIGSTVVNFGNYGPVGDTVAIGASNPFAIIWFNKTALGGTAADGDDYGLFTIQAPSPTTTNSLVLPTANSGAPSFAPLFAGNDALRPMGFEFASAIPEPSTMLLGALGALGLLRRRR